MINWTSVKLSDLNKHRYMRMDARYWIQKSLLKKKKKKKKNDSRQYMVLSCDGVSLLFSNLSLSKILEFAEDIRTLSDDDKQRPIGVLIRKHLCIPCRDALEPRSIDTCQSQGSQLAWRINGSGVKDLVNYQ